MTMSSITIWLIGWLSHDRRNLIVRDIDVVTTGLTAIAVLGVVIVGCRLLAKKGLNFAGFRNDVWGLTYFVVK
jgi:hypothetical protein